MKPREIGEFVRLTRLVSNAREIWNGKRHRGDLVVHFRDGRRLALRGGSSDVHVFLQIFAGDEYRLRGSGPWKTVLDLGGNVGCFAARVAREAERVIVFEPDPSNLPILGHNLADERAITVVPHAVAGEPGAMKLHVASGGQVGGRSTLYADLARFQDESVEVEVTTLDRVFEEHAIGSCDLLKIDVEGAEYEILHGASAETLARIGRIVGEYHDVRPEDPRTRIAAFQGFLEESGFDVETLPSRRNDNTGLFFAQRRA